MRSAIVPVLALLLCGCAGYKLGPGKPYYMKDVNTVAVPTFKNNTLVPRIEVLTANSLIKQFQTDGTYEITSEDRADAIVEGTIASIERRAARSLRGNVLATTEFEVDLKIAYTVTQRTTGTYSRISGRRYRSRRKRRRCKSSASSPRGGRKPTAIRSNTAAQIRSGVTF
jgi:hypothetical protein